MRLQAYVLVRVLVGMGTALAAVASVIALVNLVEVSRALSGRPDVEFADLLTLTLLKSPIVILLLLPFSVLFGAMGGFVVLNRRGELIAIRAAGVSAWRFVGTSAVASFLLGLVAIATLNPAASALNQDYEARKAELTGDRTPGAGKEIWLSEGGAKGQIVIHAKSMTTSRGPIALTEVTVFIQNAEADHAQDVSRRIDAQSAVLQAGAWRLEHVREVRADGESIGSEVVYLPSSLDGAATIEKAASPNAISFWRLASKIETARRTGYSSRPYELRFAQLLATPVLLAAMTLLAGAFSLRMTRLGDTALLAALGVATGFGVFLLNQFCGAIGLAGIAPVAVAAWTPPLLALLFGCTVLCYTEDG